ncbi:hypothetical protein HOR87_gp13 [Marinomonas phage CB5A]|uniref:Uncharacterized protein n=1 Tax=Marinomonas phage CB5A TaxID=2022859 RepID=A0A222G3D9_9CAUD|nr:hypothetical protein HOR87_gp13 [Marinomonas phage CB5A]ASP46280.1 hypothetical protein [Marinomonas phage CB5A]
MSYFKIVDTEEYLSAVVMAGEGSIKTLKQISTAEVPMYMISNNLMYGMCFDAANNEVIQMFYHSKDSICELLGLAQELGSEAITIYEDRELLVQLRAYGYTVVNKKPCNYVGVRDIVTLSSTLTESLLREFFQEYKSQKPFEEGLSLHDSFNTYMEYKQRSQAIDIGTHNHIMQQVSITNESARFLTN